MNDIKPLTGYACPLGNPPASLFGPEELYYFFILFFTSREVFVSAIVGAQREVDVPYTYKWARDPNMSARTKTIKQTARRTPGHVSRRPNRWRNNRNTENEK